MQSNYFSFCKWPFLFFILMLWFAVTLTSQNCDNCPEILNTVSDFTVDDYEAADCPVDDSFLELFAGFEMISQNCIDGWFGDGHILNRSINTWPGFTDLKILPNVDDPLMLQFDDFWGNGTDNDVSCSINNTSTNPDDSFSMEFDYASVCFKNLSGFPEPGTEFKTFDEITPEGVLRIGFNGILLESIDIDDETDIRDGWVSHCLDGFVNDESTLLMTLDYQLNVDDETVDCFVMIDNVEVNCRIDNSRLDLETTNLDDFTFRFELISDDSGVPAAVPVSFEWNFGDGSTSDESTPTHQYDQPGSYNVSVVITNSFGCCTTLEFTHEFDYCDAHVLSGNTWVGDIEAMFGVNSAAALAGVSDFFTVDGTLTIDKDVTFNDMEIYLTEGSSILVFAGGRFDMNGGVISHCGDRWNSITVNIGGTLDFNGVSIDHASTAIYARPSSTVHLKDNLIRNCFTGMEISGDANLSDFQGNEFNECQTGVHVGQSNNFISLTGLSNNRNTFSNCNEGMYLIGCTGQISFNEFFDCRNGINTSATDFLEIMDNNMTVEYMGISMSGGGWVSIHNNFIESENYGISGRKVHTDIGGPNASHANMIIAPHFGVGLYYNSTGQIKHNIINTIGEGWNDAAGVYLDDNEMEVSDNIITVEDVQAGVAVNSSEGNVVQHNSLTTTDCDRGIYVTSGSANVEYNIITGHPYHGIRIANAGGSRVECNLIEADSKALDIRWNSDVQSIIGNTFLGADIDVRTRSILGKQKYHNNVFELFAETVGLNQTEALNSQFIVDNPTEAPDDWDLTDFVLIEKNTDGSGEDCDGPPGPAFQLWWEFEMICWYMDELERLKVTRPKVHWVKKSQFYRKFIIYIPYWLWPDCMKEEWERTDPVIKELTIMTAQIEQLRSMDSDDDASIATLKQQLREGSRDPLIITQLRDYYLQKNANMEEEINLQLIHVGNLVPASEIESVWIETYEYRLRQMSDEIFGEDDLSSLRTTAFLCPGLYGDPVHWARGILSAYESITYLDDEGCTDVIEGREIDHAREATVKAIVHPNPSSDYYLLDLTEEQTGRLVISNAQGVKMMDKLITGSHRINAITWPTGVYYLELRGKSDRIILTEKLVKVN